MKLLVITVLFIAVRAQSDLKCPESSDVVGICLFDLSVNCIDDSKCSKGQRCCSGGCGSVCTDLVKSGTCPAPPPLAATSCLAPVKDSCTTDSQCQGKAKCCDHPCGKHCVDPDGGSIEPLPWIIPSNVHPGTCPAPPPLALTSCLVPIKDSCTTDSQCQGKKKCCDHPCGKHCVDPDGGSTEPLPPIMPIDVHPGTCPALPIGVAVRCAGPYAALCKSDLQCTDNEKCCPGFCQTSCTKIASSKSGSCPVPASGFLVRCALINDCPGDSSCPGTQKCCKGPCGKKCSDTVDTKSGTCPAPADPALVLCKTRGDDCYKDGTCPGSQKCCQGPCGNKCQDTVSQSASHSGSCPYIRPGVLAMCAAIFKPPCQGDGECVATEKCCKGLCGTSCVKSVSDSVKSGTCPKPPSALIVKCNSFQLMGRDACRIDGHCPGNDKCCPHPCGKYCGIENPEAEDPKPVLTKPGTCVRRRSMFRFRCRRQRNLCSSDSDCRGQLKCCLRACGRRCRRPARNSIPREPSSPVTTSTLEQCPPKPKPANCFMYQNDCNKYGTERPCASGLKCCDTICGIGCVKPVTVYVRG